MLPRGFLNRATNNVTGLHSGKDTNKSGKPLSYVACRFYIPEVPKLRKCQEINSIEEFTDMNVIEILEQS